jgi:hypothetical protein
MPGSAIADLLERRPLELAVRAVLAFGSAMWLVALLSPTVLSALLPYYEQFVQRLDDHYRVDFALSHRTGHDRIGSDLVVLGHAAVVRTYMIFAADKTIMLAPGQVLSSSTAIGVLMQPASVIIGMLLAWPLRSAVEAAPRLAFGAGALLLWQLLGIPLSLWVYFRDIPAQAFGVADVTWSMLLDRFLLNGGSVVVGALLAIAALAAGRHSAEIRADGRSGPANDLPAAP